MAERRFIYVGNSMLGVFAPGDELTAVPANAPDVKRGDIVVFRNDLRPHPYVHRVIAVSEQGIVTQGDNNLKPDRLPIATGAPLYVVKSAVRNGSKLAVRRGDDGWRQFRSNQRRLRLKCGAKAALRPFFRMAPLRLFAPKVEELKISEFTSHRAGGEARVYLYLGGRPVARFSGERSQWVVLGWWKLLYSPRMLDGVRPSGSGTCR